MSDLSTLKEAEQEMEISLLRRRVLELEALLGACKQSRYTPNPVETVALRSSDVRCLTRIVTVESSYDAEFGGFRVNGVFGIPGKEFQVSLFCEDITRLSESACARILVQQHGVFVRATLDGLAKERRR